MPNLGVYFSESKPVGPLFWNEYPLEEPLWDILAVFDDLRNQCIKRIPNIGDITKVIFLIEPQCECLLIGGVDVVGEGGLLRSLTKEQFATVLPITSIELFKFLLI